MFELNQKVWCYYDDGTIVTGTINNIEPYIGVGHNHRRMVLYEVLMNFIERDIPSYVEECDIYDKEEDIKQRVARQKEIDMINNLTTEYNTYLGMKESYPNLLKESTFEQEVKDAIEYLEAQIRSGYLDFNFSNCDELSFTIMEEALKSYKNLNNL